jgi:DNA-binding response OmpR family regulator
MSRILLVEDDDSAARAVEKSLKIEEGFVLKRLPRPERLISNLLDFKPDLILLDIGLADYDGRQILKEIRRNSSVNDIPVIFLTGLSGEKDKALGLDLGADDYVTKPFGALELLARIRAVLRRGRFRAPKTPKTGLFIDLESREAFWNGKPLNLRPREFEILALLASSPGKALERFFLIERTSPYESNASPRSLDAHIKNIRKKLGKKASALETVPKVGYRLNFDALQ